MKYPQHLLLDLYVTQQFKESTSLKNSVLPSYPFITSFGINNRSLNSTQTIHYTTKKISQSQSSLYLQSSSNTTLFDIHFLRKEKLYTKLMK